MAEEERIQYKFMIPADLKSKLERSAYENRRSLSAEIIERLHESFDPFIPEDMSEGSYLDQLRDLEIRIKSLRIAHLLMNPPVDEKPE